MYIFFDSETNGLPKDYKGKMKDLDNWPRIIQLAWQLVDRTGEVLQKRCFLIKPDGWEIPSVEMYVKQGFNEVHAANKAKFWIEHGYTTERNQKEGLDMEDVLEQFLVDYEQAEWLIAHNVSFDYPILGAEMIRYQKRAERKLKRFCTMLATVDYCKIPGQYGSFKWPRLEELHQIVFQKAFENAHDAMADVTACKDIFFELKNRGIIALPKFLDDFNPNNPNQ